MGFTVPSDYTGEVNISQNKFDKTDLQLFIDRYEKETLQDLLGCTLYDLFIADWDGLVFSEARFTVIYNAICNDENGCPPNKSRGIKEMLKSYVFFFYTRQQAVVNSSIGNSTSTGVASEPATSGQAGMVLAYNDGVRDYQNIQWFIRLNRADYPEYVGINQEKNSLI